MLRQLTSLVPLVLIAVLLTAAGSVSDDPVASGAKRLDYPDVRRGSTVDTYHGIEVADPYRWLEDLDSAETQAWMKAQEELFDDFLDHDAASRIYRTIDALSQTGAQYSAPIYAGGSYFYSVRQPRQRHPVLHRREGLGGRETAVLDLNALLSDDESFGGFSVSPGGTYLAYRAVAGGSRWGDLRIVESGSGEPCDGKLDGLPNAATLWTEDESGFYYVDHGRSEDLARGDDLEAEVRFHSLGTDPARDPVVYARPNQPDILLTPALSADRRSLILALYQGTATRNRILLGDLSGGPIPKGIEELLGDGEHAYTFIGSRGDQLFFYTNQGAPNGRVIALDRGAPRDQRHPRVVVPESAEVLAGGSTVGGNAMSVIGERLVLLYRLASTATLRVFRLDGHLERKIPLGAGWIGSGLVGDPGVAEVWYTFNGFVEPSTVFRLDLGTGESRPFFSHDLPIDKSRYVLKHVFYESKDGTRVPLFVAHKRGLRRAGKNPVFMYGYGYGGWVAVPWYQPHVLAWLEMGGVFAMPGIRGGGEYGDEWRDAGIRLNRQNAIDDYVAAAEWLIAERYTSPGRVVANGWSASGSLAAAAVQQRGDLFGAGLIGIPSTDLLRYHHFTALKGWTSGYGSSDDPEEFRVLLSYSPYHNVRADRCGPPILVTVGEHDPVTPPLHGYKLVAALQHARRQQEDCPSPALLKIVRGVGHAFGKTPAQARRTQSEELAFLAAVLDMKVP